MKFKYALFDRILQEYRNVNLKEVFFPEIAIRRKKEQVVNDWNWHFASVNGHYKSTIRISSVVTVKHILEMKK